MDLVNFQGIIYQASNLRTGTNSEYTKADFLAIFPQFTNHISDPIITTFLLMATNSLEEARWKGQWKFAMALFIAHYCQLYLNNSSPADTLLEKAKSLGTARGLASSKSVGDVSVSYDYNTVAEGLKGWAAWNLTSYGQQLATMGKLVGKGGMYVW